MSLANVPQYSNGNKTLTITMKSNYKWSNGKPLTADDLLFYHRPDQGRPSRSRPANWAGYTPKLFPDNLVSTSEPNSDDPGDEPEGGGQPDLVHRGLLSSREPATERRWAKTSASGSVIPSSAWNASNMAGIFKYLTAQSKSVSTYTTNPLWQVVDGPYKLSQYNTTTGAFTMVPNTTYGGPHVTPMSNFQAVPFTSDAAEFNAVKSKSIDVGLSSRGQRPAAAPGAQARLQLLRRSRTSG